MQWRQAAGGLALAVATVCVASAQSGVQGDKQFQAALHKEAVEGDLKAAIEEYRKVSSRPGVGRDLAATALVRMAECYQRLGDPQARVTYARVVREFADQPAAAEARTRLAAMGTVGGAGSAASTTGDRVIWAGPEVFSDGRVSLDGRWISYTDWQLTGNLMLRDVAAGKDRSLTGNKDWSVGNAYTSVFSRDGKHVAYGWRQYGEKAVNELRVMAVDETVPTAFRRVFGTEDVDFVYPTDWSPDGRWLAVAVTRKDNSGQIALIGAQDGSFRALKSFGWRRPDKIFFSPDGRYLAYDLPSSDTGSERDVFVIAVDGSGETRPVEHPAHDVVMGWTPDGRHLLFASNRTGTAGLWAVTLAEGRPTTAPTLLKPDIGSFASLGLTASGTIYIVRDAGTQSLQVAPIDLATGRQTGPSVLEAFTDQRADWSPDGSHLAYPAIASNRERVLKVRSVESGQLRELRPALHYFNFVRWTPDGRSLMAFGRDFKGRQGIYQIDGQSGRASFIAEGSSSAHVSPNGKKAYYFSTPDQGPAAFVERDLASGETRELFRPSPGLGFAELSPDGRFLAAGRMDIDFKVSKVMLIPVAGGEPRELLRASHPEALQPFGAMSWTPDSQAVIVLKTKGDRKEPWLDRKELWMVPVGGGQARRLDIPTDAWTAEGFRVHPKGTHIAFLTGQPSQEVWALESVLPRLSASK